MGLFSTLTLIFVVLKLTGVIAWSWLLVLSPLIAGLALSVLLFLAAALIATVNVVKARK